MGLSMNDLRETKSEKSPLSLFRQLKPTDYAIPDMHTNYLPYADTLSAPCLSLDPASTGSCVCGTISLDGAGMERAINEIISVPTLRDLSYAYPSESVVMEEVLEKAKGPSLSDMEHWKAFHLEGEAPADESMIRLAMQLKLGIVSDLADQAQKNAALEDNNRECACDAEKRRLRLPEQTSCVIDKTALPLLPKHALKDAMEAVPQNAIKTQNLHLSDGELEMPTVALRTAQNRKAEAASAGVALSEMMTPLQMTEYAKAMAESGERQPDTLGLVEPQHEKWKKTGLESSELAIGHVVAHRYEVLSEIARGGYGVVYRARQIGIDRVVALKRLKNQNDPAVVRRFLMEAEIIKNLIHPNTIQLIDAGNDEDNHLYIVMEYIEGRSLQSIFHQKESISVQRAVHITMQILKSLNEAHQRGIIHRDLKPSNILLREVIGEPDFVKVLDFGIAKQTRLPVPKLTMDGTVMGTPQYIAPELFFGKQPSAASDIYAIGLILAQMVIGKSLVPTDMAQALQWHHSGSEAELPSWVRQTAIGEVILKAVRKNPNERYRNVVEMMADLQRVSMATGEMASDGHGRRMETSSGLWMIGFLMTLIVILTAGIVFL